jgi:hypothetical protein
VGVGVGVGVGWVWFGLVWFGCKNKGVTTPKTHVTKKRIYYDAFYPLEVPCRFLGHANEHRYKPKSRGFLKDTKWTFKRHH